MIFGVWDNNVCVTFSSLEHCFVNMYIVVLVESDLYLTKLDSHVISGNVGKQKKQNVVSMQKS